jgi:hypothetical protein
VEAGAGMRAQGTRVQDALPPRCRRGPDPLSVPGDRHPPPSGAAEALSLRETFHIEVLGPEEGEVQTRISVRMQDLEGARERALRLFARARVPQRSGAPAEAVRVIDGAGREVFHWTRFDAQD